MLNKIVNITSNPGYKNPKGNTPSALKHLLRENSASDTGDKIELSPALKYLKKLEWNLKEVKVSDNKYYISFDFQNFEFNARFSPSEINSNSHINYKIKPLPLSPTQEQNLSDSSKLSVELSLSIGFYSQQTGFLATITNKDSGSEILLDSVCRNSMNKLRALFDKLFLACAENVNLSSGMIKTLVEDSLKDLSGLSRINDLLILFLEKLSGEKIFHKITAAKDKDEEALVLIDAININSLN